MGLNKKEVNLRRLLAAAPHQQNQAKLVHYVTTSRELLEHIGEEAAAGGVSSISKAKLNEYSEKIEALAARLSVPEPESVETVQETSVEEIVSVSEKTENRTYPSHILRRRTASATKVEDRNHESAVRDTGAPVKLDAEAHAHIEKHRKLQDDLTDEMVTLAQQLKESSLMMNKSLNDTEMVIKGLKGPKGGFSYFKGEGHKGSFSYSKGGFSYSKEEGPMRGFHIPSEAFYPYQSRYWILLRGPLSRAWRALDAPIFVQSRYTRKAPRLHASLGSSSLLW